jgi:hypothetical protein
MVFELIHVHIHTVILRTVAIGKNRDGNRFQFFVCDQWYQQPHVSIVAGLYGVGPIRHQANMITTKIFLSLLSTV